MPLIGSDPSEFPLGMMGMMVVALALKIDSGAACVFLSIYFREIEPYFSISRTFKRV